jgi:hypothetical protein
MFYDYSSCSVTTVNDCQHLVSDLTHNWSTDYHVLFLSKCDLVFKCLFDTPNCASCLWHSSFFDTLKFKLHVVRFSKARCNRWQDTWIKNHDFWQTLLSPQAHQARQGEQVGVVGGPFLYTFCAWENLFLRMHSSVIQQVLWSDRAVVRVAAGSCGFRCTVPADVEAV